MQVSRSEPKQLPLKGFKAPFGKTKAGSDMLVEGMGGGRYRIHIVRKKR